jgi:hypothetical protein
MPSPITVYADTVNHYIAGGIGLTWSQIRDGDSSVVTGVGVNPTTARHFVIDNGLTYEFMRTYIQFDLRSITDPITSMQLYVNGVSGFTPGNTTYVAYAGNKSTLSNSSSDYNLYITATAGGPELSTITIQPEIFKSCLLDITTYPPRDPLDYYKIALVSQPDFQNTVDGTSGQTRIHNSSGKIPYLIINGGYPNDVNGVTGTSMIKVSGVASADITNIMGI